jgi:hypothetical protein
LGSSNGDIEVEGAGHSGAHVEAVTKNSLFYRRKTLANNVYSAIRSYFYRISATTIYETHAMSKDNLSQLFRDVQVMMFSDDQRYHGNYLLDSDPNCHHIQINESKFGKQKNHRGHRVER